MPYINSNLNCTYSSESSVIRVITEKEDYNSSVKILDSWIEIPIYTKHVIYISTKYKGLMIKDNRIQDEIIRDIEKWNKFLTIKQSTSIQSCLSASIYMHKKLNNINTVAWDWISTSMGPKLLEGNALFGLQIIQIFNELKTKLNVKF